MATADSPGTQLDAVSSPQAGRHEAQPDTPQAGRHEAQPDTPQAGRHEAQPDTPQAGRHEAQPDTVSSPQAGRHEAQPDTVSSPEAERHEARRPIGVYLLLALILLAGFGLRTFNVDWADGQLPHPDERSTIAFYAPTIRWPQEPGTLLDPRLSTLNPLWDVNAGQRRSYTYGHFPLYLLVGLGHLTVKLAPVADQLGAPETLVSMMRIANGSPGFAWVGRVLMAVADTITLLYMFLLGRRLYGARAGLLAAALGAFTVLQIQLAHFFAVDPISTTFTVAALYHALRMADAGRTAARHAILTGVMAALAIACKFSAAPILAAPVVAGLLVMRRARRLQSPDSPTPHPAPQLPGWLLAAIALVVAAVVFAISSPFVLLDFENFRRAVIDEQGAMVRGIADFPFTRQYRGTTPYLYFIVEMIKWGMGWPLGVLGWLAFAWALIKALGRRASAGELILLSWLVPYFGITGSFLAKFNRYMAPVVPLLVVLGVGLLWAATQGRPYPTWAATHRRRSLRTALGLLILLPTVLWALAFVNGVYGREHTFITASKWMYANVPDGSVWITEHWEEGMPLHLPIPGGSPGEHGWRNVMMPMYEEDTQGKYEILRQNMREGDYYVLATKRLYGALPHLPERYPLSIKFYDLLFSGQLGYELAAEFTAYPSLFGIAINDQGADESFWVYDHPRVLIYKKVRDLSDSEWDQLLGNAWATAIPGYTGQKVGAGAGSRPSELEAGPTLLLDRPVGSLPDVGQTAWNPLRRSSLGSLLFWWLALALVHLLTWPIAFTIFGQLRDRGYGFSRALGLILLAWLSWILPALRVLPNTLAVVLLAFLAVGLLGWWLWRRQREEMRAFWAAHRRFLWISEGIFTGAFLFFLLIRLLNPDLWQPWQGGEKFMEFAFLNAVVRTPYFPPYDPYFAGGVLNYYYYGYQVLAVLIKLTGISTTIAFNLAIPTLFALTAAGVFSLVYSLAPVRALRGIRPQAGRHEAQARDAILRIATEDEAQDPQAGRHEARGAWWRRGVGAGLAGIVIVTIMGNLEGGLILFRQLGERSGSAFVSQVPLLQGLVRGIAGLFGVVAGRIEAPGYNFWTPSRVIPFTINEFPFWSFLFADLHPHMIGIPFTVLFLALAYNLVASYGERLRGGAWAGLLALPLTLGAIGAINTWDLPTYLGIGILAWGIRAWKTAGTLPHGAPAAAQARPAVGERFFAPTLVFVLGLGGLAYLLYRPFYANYTTVFDTGVGLTYMQTNLGEWLRIWGFFIFIAISFIVVELLRRPGRGVLVLRWLSGLLRRHRQPARFLDRFDLFVRPGWEFTAGRAAIVVVGMLALVLAWRGYSVIALLLPLLLFTALFLFRRATSAEAQFRALLFFTGLLVLTGVEVFYIKDFLCGCGEGLFSRQHGEYYRMNTLFKFYSQVWVLLGVGAAAVLPALVAVMRGASSSVAIRRIASRGPKLRGGSLLRVGWFGILGVLLALSLVFPLLGTPNRVDDRFPGPRPARTTLDGMAFMAVGQYNWPDAGNTIQLAYDYEAIRWLQDTVTGTPVLAEAPASWYPVNGQNQGYDYYRAGGLRVSSLTGLPTFLGQHQGEQRFGSQTGPREQIGREFFETTDIARLRQITAELGVEYIYIGQLERILFTADQLRKFDALVELGEAQVVFQNDGVTIYQIQ